MPRKVLKDQKLSLFPQLIIFNLDLILDAEAMEEDRHHLHHHHQRDRDDEDVAERIIKSFESVERLKEHERRRGWFNNHFETVAKILKCKKK
jgi:hypothetical protein